ncbi:MAG: dehydrogenase [Prevotella sp.]
MADNYLERHREDYEERKAQWLRKKKHLPKKKVWHFSKPEDESL